MWLARKATVTTISSKPCRFSSSTMCSIIGRLASGSIGFGAFEVSGRSRRALAAGHDHGLHEVEPTRARTVRLDRPGARRGPRGTYMTQRDVAEHQAGDAGDPGEHPGGVGPAEGAVRGQEQREGDHQAEGAGLAEPGDVDAAGARARRARGWPRPRATSRTSTAMREPERAAAVDHDAADADEEQQPVGHRVEDLAQRRRPGGSGGRCSRRSSRWCRARRAGRRRPPGCPARTAGRGTAAGSRAGPPR